MTEITSQLSTALADRYRIESHLGEGGMATVYLAHDVRHDRKVALKVLRPELAAVIGAERFLQEIKVTANLQHPHILPLHDSGEAGSFLYYVMPYIEGDTLRDKLDRERQLAIEEAVEITRSIASALDYAHRQGVIHRDIKPENVLLHDGQALVADFGIALAVSEASGKRLTETGLSIGTPHYMSPEQAMGDRELDARSDVYSVGAMLYEMLAGEPPYQGSSAQAIVAKVITEKAPPVTAARDTVPGHINAAIGKALNKMPADRFGSAAAFADALANPAFTIPGATLGTEVPAAGAGPRTVPLWTLAVALALVIVTGAMALVGRGGSDTAGAVTRFTLEGMDGIPTPTQWDRIDVSPDGSLIASLRNLEGAGSPQIVLRSMDQLEGRLIDRTDDARNPTFSPDGEWLAFFAGGTIAKVRLAGGPPLELAGDATGGGLSWGSDGTIVFHLRGRLMRMPDAGGAADTLTIAEPGRSHRWPDHLPNGKGVLFTDYDGTEGSRIAVVNLESGEVTELVEGFHARYAPTGHLVYASPGGSLLAIPFDQNSMTTTGAAVPLLQELSITGAASARFAIADNGTLVYETGSSQGRALVRVDRNGVETPLFDDLANFNEPRYSPDGSQIAVTIVDELNDIWVFDVAGQTSTRLTVEGSQRSPAWSPDGRFVTFGSTGRDSIAGVFRRPVDGSTPAELLAPVPGGQASHMGGWTPDGRHLVYRITEESRNLWMLTLDGDTATSERLLATDFHEESPVLSPDGRWLAYTSNETGRQEVYVRAFPDGSGRIPVSTDGGTEPLWSRDGSELFYRTAGSIVSAAVELTPSFRVVSRQNLFDASPYVTRVLLPGYDVHPDGSFLMLKPTGGASSMIVVLNWLEELQEAVGNE